MRFAVLPGKGSLIPVPLPPRIVWRLSALPASTGVGISLAETCAKTLRPVSLELGGNDPLIIFDDADYEKALSETVAGRIGNAGQTCCASKRFLVQKGIFDKFAKDLVARLSAVKVGDPADPSVEMGPCVREADASKRQIKLTIGQGGELLLGGKRDGAFVEPTVIQGFSKDADIARDMECFGLSTSDSLSIPWTTPLRSPTTRFSACPPALSPRTCRWP